IGRVAEACGYLTQAAFSKAFKNAWGVTPGQFRQQHARLRVIASKLRHHRAKRLA
ncbi:AraC family transcriptional regulator, partial [Cronobacter sakazakii]|nr:AraC family transcriptional regulator [Cronobacter sakazakii]